MAIDFVQAVVAGDTAAAEGMLVDGADDTLKGKVRNTVEIFSRYQIEAVEIASNREWRSGTTDRRIEVRFQFRPRDSSADAPAQIGLMTVRTAASGGLFSVSDVLLDRPTE
jgi:hypothetical protein